jgi:hypothetical protein
MATSYTTLLGLALPATGELSGTWGDTVNNYISTYVDSAVAGTQTISGSQTAVTLSVTNGSSLVQAGAGATGSSQYTIINCTGNPASLLTVTVPAASKSYLVINSTSTSQSVKIVGAGPTTGVTLVATERAIVAWNGSDFVKVASTSASTINSGTLAVAYGGTGINSLGTGVATFLGTPSSANLASAVTDETGSGSLVFATSPTLVTPILGTPQSGNFSSGTFTWPTFNQNTTGTAAGLSATLAVGSGGTGRTVGNYSIYANEIHVGKDGNDTTGDGTLINPVLTITKALTLVGAGRNTVIVHPGSYSESPTVSSANTTIATAELTGANTQISGTLTLSAAARISGIKLTNLTITGSGSTYISNCTVDTQVIKSGSNYVEIINTELQCVSGVQITGAGTVSIVGNKCWAVAVSNASANVLIKDCFQVITPSVTAGTLQLDGSAIFAASPASNAVTSSAGSFITLANCFVLNSAGTNVERVSLAGSYSILNLVYDKTNSTFAGTNLNAIDYFSAINADTLVLTNNLAVAYGGTGLSTTPANGALDIGNGTGFTRTTLTAGTGVTITNSAGGITIAASGSGGTVTSVTGTSPVASSGGSTPAISLAASYGDTQNPYASKTANYVLAAPNGSSGAPTFRAIVAADIPTLNQNTTGTAAGLSATLAVGSGGTGVTSSTGSGSVVLSTSPSLTTPVLGTPTSGTLSNCTVDGTDSVGFRNIPQNAQTGSYTLVIADSGKHIYRGSGGAATWTIPANSSVAYAIGTAITFINLSATSVSIAITTDTMYLSSAGTTGTRTLAQYGSATAIKITSTSWVISGSGLT